ncbi:MAG TPA: P-loop NTPase [Candidatus Hydrogenedentes bacterium]|nr:P-loop NTPase [Candidatus Hydrogenedentota bacterium]
MATEAQILEALGAIVDPDLNRDIVSLGFVKNLKIEGGAVSFDIELTTPACPVKDAFKRQAEAAVGALPGVDRVEVTMTARHRPKTQPDLDLGQIGAIVAVSSCKGGVGKSTVAALLARALQREGLAVGLLDADVHGPSLPTLLNTHHPEVVSFGEQFLPVEVDGLKTMSLGYMLGDRPAVMRGPMVSGYVMQLLGQTEWGPLDYLLIDLPPGTGDIQLTLTQRVALDGALIVTTPQALSLVDVARGILMFERVDVPVLGIVENMASFTCDGCGKEHHPFGDGTRALKERFGLDTLARLPILPGLHTAATRDAGADIPAFAALAEHLHRAVGMRRAGRGPQPQVRTDLAFVHVLWPYGTEDRIPNRALRASCQCAVCVDEYTREQKLDPDSVPEDIHAEEVQYLGNYAVALSWSDGHSSGIFSWEHLKNVAKSAAAGDCGCGRAWKE